MESAYKMVAKRIINKVTSNSSDKQPYKTYLVRLPSLDLYSNMFWVISFILFYGLLIPVACFAQQSYLNVSQYTTSLDPNIVRSAQQRQLEAERLLQEFEEPNEPKVMDLGAEDIKEEPSTIELLLSGRSSDIVTTELEQFGYDVFSNKVTTFAPVTSVPVGANYIVGPGDSFSITVWGTVNEKYPVVIDRAGEIGLPELGVLKVAGMSFEELEDYLQNEFDRKYDNFKLAITMGRLRTIQVFIVGEAKTPGSYTVSSLSTVINALFTAGGPSKNGSLRNIQILRIDQEPNNIDLYEFLLGGDKSSDIRLKDGDTIYISLIGPVVGVAGNVKRPAIYEMVGNMTLSQVLELAGGITHAGWLQRVQVERVENHRKRIVVDFDISGSEGIENRDDILQTIVMDGDVVKVFPVLKQEQNVVSLEGHVNRPGLYELKPNMRLSDILSSYEVFLPQPNLEYGEIKRLVKPDLHPVVIPFSPQKVLSGIESENIILSNYDTIHIYSWDERLKKSVQISGQVYEPNEFRLIPNMRISDLVNAAGGLKSTAYLEKAEITRRHISQSGMRTEKIDINLDRAMAGDPEQNILLREYDFLTVRPIPELEFDLTATINGEVMFPGVYPIKRGETLSSLIERAGGYTERAYLKGAVFTRESAKIVQEKRMDELMRQLEESILASSEEAISGALDSGMLQEQTRALEAKKELLSRLRAVQIDGRVVVKLSKVNELKDSKYDIELENNDMLVIPKRPGVISVVGEVYNPTSLLYEDGKTVQFYLSKVGGMTKEADKEELSVIKADGSVISMAQRGAGKVVWDTDQNVWLFGGFVNSKLDPGDTIVVPRKVDKFFWLRTTKDITQVIFQLAVTAGVVLAL